MALWYGTLAFLLGTLGALLWAAAGDRPLIVIATSAVAAAIALKLVRRLLLQAVQDWSFSIRALVNQGRHGLAEKHGLAVPDELDSETEMWQALQSVVEYGERAKTAPATLTKYRSQDAAERDESDHLRIEGTVGQQPVSLQVTGDQG